MDLLPLNVTTTESTRPTIIAGPCSAESEEQVLETAHRLARQGVRLFRAGIWKPRTKPGGFEGIGFVGLDWLKRVKQETGMLLATEVATEEHVRQALQAGVDILWVGARTTVNPFAVQEIADALHGTDVPVLVKNPVNPDLELWIGALERIHRAGIRRLGAIHRGFSSGGKSKYRNEPMWSIPMELKRRIPGLPIFCDPSHIGGNRELIEPLVRKGTGLGFEGLLIESHCRPETAWSDASQQLVPEKLGEILRRLDDSMAETDDDPLDDLRHRIDAIDEQLLELLSRRMKISDEIGVYKKEHDLPVVQPSRLGEVIEHRINVGCELDLNPRFVRGILMKIHGESVRLQKTAGRGEL